MAGTEPAADQRGKHEARARLDAVAAGVALRLKRLAIAIVAAVERSDGEDRAFGTHLIFGRQFGGGEGAVAEALVDRPAERVDPLAIGAVFGAPSTGDAQPVDGACPPDDAEEAVEIGRAHVCTPV